MIEKLNWKKKKKRVKIKDWFNEICIACINLDKDICYGGESYGPCQDTIIDSSQWKIYQWVSKVPKKESKNYQRRRYKFYTIVNFWGTNM